MNQRKDLRRPRVARPTLLVTGEGYAEVELLRIVRREYTSDRQGVSMSISNARGKGASHVINDALAARGRHDVVAAFFDTDVGWSDEVRKNAEDNGILVLPCDPCIEAVLLTILGVKPRSTSAANKKLFEKSFGGPAHDQRVLNRIITREVLENARRDGIPPIAELIRAVLLIVD